MTTPDPFDCMVCGEWRPYDLISVAYRSSPIFDDWPYEGPRPHTNVRYCNDRPGCAAYANAAGHWEGPPRRPEPAS